MSMILYNIRHRGTYEYEKFVLNILQLSNETRRLENALKSGAYGSLKDLAAELDGCIKDNVGEDSLPQKLLVLRMELDE